jgi:hypothetical protein
MTVKDLIRPLPGVRQLSLFRQRANFNGSAQFWERNYTKGRTSGAGSYGMLGDSKAEFLNPFVQEHNVRSVIEFGCGDGHQLSLASYPRYVGLDVSRTAIDLCKRRFADDSTKSFFLYDGGCFVDKGGLFRAELAISLDVVYHLIEDSIFEAYMTHLFASAQRYVIIYATNMEMRGVVPQVRHRNFTSWIEENGSQWQIKQVAQGADSGPGRADFFVYEALAPQQS